MKQNNIEMVYIKGYTQNRVLIELNNKDTWLTEDNIYDLVENPKLNGVVRVFSVDGEYPAMKFGTERGSVIAEYLPSPWGTMSIIDKSPKGIIKWLIRTVKFKAEDTEVFDITMESTKND